jgi:hypothetical protein
LLSIAAAARGEVRRRVRGNECSRSPSFAPLQTKSQAPTAQIEDIVRYDRLLGRTVKGAAGRELGAT